VLGASLSGDLTRVTLDCTSLYTGITYRLGVSNLLDKARFPNPVAPDTATNFQYLRVFLVEDFAGETLRNWTVVDEGTRDAPSHWRARFGRLEQNGNIFGPTVLTVDHRQGTFLVYNKASALNWSNYIMQTSVLTPDDDGIGVLFRYQNTSNYYKLDLDRQKDFHKLFKVVDGVETVLRQDTGGYAQNVAIPVRVEVTNTQINIVIDGTNLFGGPIFDNSLRRGTVALYTWGSEGAIFDDVVVVPEGEVPEFDHSSSETFVVPPPPALTTRCPWMDGGWCGRRKRNRTPDGKN